MTDIEIPRSLVPSPAPDEVATLYARYHQTATARPFDQEFCEAGYSDWKAAMEAAGFASPERQVSPNSVIVSPLRPAGITDEEIAEVSEAIAKAFRLQSSVNRAAALLSHGHPNPDRFLGYVPNIDQW